MVKLNFTPQVKTHSIKDYVAFRDSDQDFYLIADDKKHIICLLDSGCQVTALGDLETIEDFLFVNYGEYVRPFAFYKNAADYTITIDG